MQTTEEKFATEIQEQCQTGASVSDIMTILSEFLADKVKEITHFWLRTTHYWISKRRNLMCY